MLKQGIYSRMRANRRSKYQSPLPSLMREGIGAGVPHHPYHLR